MIFVIPVLGVSILLWLLVRLVNRGWKPGRRFWFLAPIAAVLAYPLTFGPACWLVSWGLLPDSGTGALYQPVFYLMADKEDSWGRTEYVHPLLGQFLRYGKLFDRKQTYWSGGGNRHVVMVTVAGTWTSKYARTIAMDQSARFPELKYDWDIPPQSDTIEWPGLRSARIH